MFVLGLSPKPQGEYSTLQGISFVVVVVRAGVRVVERVNHFKKNHIFNEFVLVLTKNLVASLILPILLPKIVVTTVNLYQREGKVRVLFDVTVDNIHIQNLSRLNY